MKKLTATLCVALFLSLTFLSVFPQVEASVTQNYGYVDYPNQHKVLYEAGLWWVFFSSNNHYYYTTSAAGGSWSSEKLLCDGSGDTHLAIVNNGTDFHYVRESVGVGLLYRKGTLGADGYISWVTAEQVASDDGLAEFPVIAVDSSNRPWITYSSDTSTKRLVTHSTLSNGTWVTAAGHPLILTGLIWYYPFPIVSLSNDQMYVAYNGGAGSTRGRLYNGTGWESEEIISSTSLRMIDLIERDGVMSLAGFTLAITESYPITRTYTAHFTQKISGVWSSLYSGFPTFSTTGEDTYSYATLTQNSSASVYLSLRESSKITVWVYEDSSWTVAKDVADIFIKQVNAIAEVTANHELGFVYQRVDGAMYELKFVRITTVPPVIDEPAVPGGSPPVTPPVEKEEKPPANQTVPEPNPLAGLGLWGLVGAVGLIAVGGVMAATSGSSGSSHGYRRRSAVKPRYSPSPKQKKPHYSKVKS